MIGTGFSFGENIIKSHSMWETYEFNGTSLVFLNPPEDHETGQSIEKNSITQIVLKLLLQLNEMNVYKSEENVAGIIQKEILHHNIEKILNNHMQSLKTSSLNSYITLNAIQNNILNLGKESKDLKDFNGRKRRQEKYRIQKEQKNVSKELIQLINKIEPIEIEIKKAEAEEKTRTLAVARSEIEKMTELQLTQLQTQDVTQIVTETEVLKGEVLKSEVLKEVETRLQTSLEASSEVTRVSRSKALNLSSEIFKNLVVKDIRCLNRVTVEAQENVVEQRIPTVELQVYNFLRENNITEENVKTWLTTSNDVQYKKFRENILLNDQMTEAFYLKFKIKEQQREKNRFITLLKKETREKLSEILTHISENKELEQINQKMEISKLLLEKDTNLHTVIEDFIKRSQSKQYTEVKKIIKDFNLISEKQFYNFEEKNIKFEKKHLLEEISKVEVEKYSNFIIQTNEEVTEKLKQDVKNFETKKINQIGLPKQTLGNEIVVARESISVLGANYKFLEVKEGTNLVVQRIEQNLNQRISKDYVNQEKYLAKTIKEIENFTLVEKNIEKQVNTEEITKTISQLTLVSKNIETQAKTEKIIKKMPELTIIRKRLETQANAETKIINKTEKHFKQLYEEKNELIRIREVQKKRSNKVYDDIIETIKHAQTVKEITGPVLKQNFQQNQLFFNRTIKNIKSTNLQLIEEVESKILQKKDKHEIFTENQVFKYNLLENQKIAIKAAEENIIHHETLLDSSLVYENRESQKQSILETTEEIGLIKRKSTESIKEIDKQKKLVKELTERLEKQELIVKELSVVKPTSKDNNNSLSKVDVKKITNEITATLQKEMRMERQRRGM